MRSVRLGPCLPRPPFVTNDPDPPELGQWEVNLPWTLKRAKDGSLSGELVTFDVNYGYDPFTQLSIELPLPYSHPAEAGFHTGAGDVLFEYKRRFGTDPEAGYFGINPQLTAPTGDEEWGLGAGRGTRARASGSLALPPSDRSLNA